MRGGLLACGVIAAFGAVMPADAAVIFDNSVRQIPESGYLVYGGNCLYNTICGTANGGYSNVYAAQKFSVSGNTNLLSARIDAGAFRSDRPTVIDYAIYAADPNNGLPGTLLFSGSSAVERQQSYYLNEPIGPLFEIVQSYISITSLLLTSGEYYFAFHAETTGYDSYAAEGLASTGAAMSLDGGSTWTPGYGAGDYRAQSMAVGLYSDRSFRSVPEPSTWAMMIVGFAGIGLVLRQRNGGVKVVV